MGLKEVEGRREIKEKLEQGRVNLGGQEEVTVGAVRTIGNGSKGTTPIRQHAHTRFCERRA